MKSLSYILFVFIINIFSMNIVNAQDKKNIEDIIKSSIESRKNGNSINDLKNTLSYFSDNAVINITTLTLEEKKYKEVLTKEEYKGLYEVMYKENILREYDLKIHEIKIQNKVAIAFFMLNYSLVNSNTGKVLSKGTEFLTATFVTKNNSWKLIELNVTDIENEKYQGECSCEVLSNDKTGGVVARVVFPKGDRIQKDLNNVYRKKVNNRDLFMVQGNKFEWTPDLEVLVLDQKLNVIEKINTAKTYENVVEVIIAYLYKNECSNLNVL